MHRRFLSLFFASLLCLHQLIIPLSLVAASEAESAEMVTGVVELQADPDSEASDKPADEVSTEADHASFDNSDNQAEKDTADAEHTSAAQNEDLIDSTPTATTSASPPQSSNPEETAHFYSENDHISSSASTSSADLSDDPATTSAKQSDLTTASEEDSEEVVGLEVQADPELVENEAELDVTTTVSATTGDNYSETDQGGIHLETGDAYSVLELIELVNVLLVQSNINIIVYDITDPEQQLADLTFATDSSRSADQDPSAGPCSGATCQPNHSQSTAELVTDLTVTARTGNNIAISEAGDIYLETGDAISLANLIQIINASLYYSDITIVIVNILVPWEGDIWLPFFEHSQLSVPETISPAEGEHQADNQAVVVTDIQVNASSGDNSQQGGQNYMQTGDAYASAEHQLLANVLIWYQQLYQLILQNEDNWSGNTYFGEATEQSQSSAEQHQESSDTEPSTSDNSSPTTASTPTSEQTTATLATRLTVEASTGGNTAEAGGTNQLATGTATAVANVIQMINTEWWFTNYFFGIINILQPWGGNLWLGAPPAYAQEESSQPEPDATPTPTPTPSPDEHVSPAAELEQGAEDAENTPSSQSVADEEELSLASVSLSLELIGNSPAAGQLAQFSSRISNTSQQPVYQPILEQTLLDSSGQVIGQTQLELPSLLPGQTTRFNFGLRTPGSANGTYTLQLVMYEGAAQMASVSNVAMLQFYITQSTQALIPQVYAAPQPPVVLGAQDDELRPPLPQDQLGEASLPQHLQSGFNPEPWMAVIPLLLLLIFYLVKPRLYRGTN